MWTATDGASLKAFRENVLGWSQGRLAEELGCDQSTVSRIEGGDQPSRPIRRLIEIIRDRHAAQPLPEPSEARA